MRYDGMSEEEILEHKKTEMRRRRDVYLRITDKYLIADYPISAERLEEIKGYRQRLREYPASEGFPETEPERYPDWVD